jgi:hypothetical protein
MNEQAVLTIQKYIDEYLFEPRSTWSKLEFDRRSYSIWAANEIITRLMDRPFDHPEIVIEGFLLEMIVFSHTKEESKRHFIFSVATEVAEDILYLFTRGEITDGQI